MHCRFQKGFILGKCDQNIERNKDKWYVINVSMDCCYYFNILTKYVNKNTEAHSHFRVC